MNPSIAIVGATGAVGELLRRALVERNFPIERIKFLASARSAGTAIEFKGQQVVVEELTPEAFAGVDIAIASTPDDVATTFVPWAREHGTVVIDESGAHRMRPDVPLIVPEVNPAAIADHQGLIASPNCSTTQMVVALKPLYDAFGIERVNVCTFQATSGAGVAGNADLREGSRAALEHQAYENTAFAYPIAFNLIPQIGSFKEQGYTSEELKMVHETHKILGDDSIRICPTCVRVPVTNCHSEVITVETKLKVSADEARNALRAAAGITVLDSPEKGQYPMPLTCSDRDDVFVGRIREDLSHEKGITFWCVSDNLRKGAATNAVQIAELLIDHQAQQCVPSNSQ